MTVEKQLALEREAFRRLKGEYEAHLSACGALESSHQEEARALSQSHHAAIAPLRLAVRDAKERLRASEDRIQHLINQQWVRDFPTTPEDGTLAAIAEACIRFGINLGRRPAMQNPRTRYVHPTTHTFAASFQNPLETIYFSWDRTTKQVVGWLRAGAAHSSGHLDGDDFDLSNTSFNDYKAGRRTALQVYLHKLATRSNPTREQ